MKRVFLELGGKSAAIILDDADFASVVPMTAFGVCMHAGQGCAMQTRVLLPRSRYDEGLELIVAGMAMIPYGDPNDPDNLMGPVISKTQYDKILDYIKIGQDEGARLVLGGGRPDAPRQGLLHRADGLRRRRQQDDHRPGGDLRSRPGRHPLRGRRRRRRHRQRLELRALGRHLRLRADGPPPWPGASAPAPSAVNGGVWYGADMPYGGYKDSGIGRQNGIEGFELYLETKIVAWPAG